MIETSKNAGIFHSYVSLPEGKHQKMVASMRMSWAIQKKMSLGTHSTPGLRGPGKWRKWTKLCPAKNIVQMVVEHVYQPIVLTIFCFY